MKKTQAFDLGTESALANSEATDNKTSLLFNPLKMNILLPADEYVLKVYKDWLNFSWEGKKGEKRG